jgi:uncharacterized protein (DUF1330 family)
VRIVALFDLTGADLAAFEAYEAAVLPILSDHGAALERRLRSCDGAMEVHILDFPSPEARQAYLNDPRRAAQQGLWLQAKVVAKSVEVDEVAAS